MRRHLTAAVLILCAAGSMRACNIPVFRYALERWKPDHYQVHVFHRGGLTKEQADVVKALEKYGPASDVVSNLEVELVDLDKADAEQTKLYSKIGKPSLPALAVRAVNLDRETTTFWTGKLDTAAVGMLVQSPARKELAKRLQAGDTAVWVLLESGDVKQDDAAFELLEKELKRVTGKLKLPQLTDKPEDKLAAEGPPLKLAFSILRVRRDDAKEEFLRSMLLKSEDDIEKRTEPMAFPVFGRGRTFGGLIGKGLTKENIEEGCGLLVAPCSCKFKIQSPGFDLLMTTDWDLVFQKRR